MGRHFLPFSQRAHKNEILSFKSRTIFRTQPLQHIGFFIGDLISPLWERSNYIERLRCHRRSVPHAKCHYDSASSTSHFELKVLLHLLGSPALWQVFPYRVHSACLTRTAIPESSASNLKMRSHSVLHVVGYEGGANVTPCAALGHSAWMVSHCKPLLDCLAPRNSGFWLKTASESHTLEYSKTGTLWESPGFTLEVIHAAAFS